ALDGDGGRLEDRDRVVAVDGLAGNAVGLSPAGEVVDRGGAADRRVLRVLVVLAGIDNRQPSHGREIQRLVKASLVDAPVSEEGHRDLPRAAVGGRERRTGRDAAAGGDDAV